MNNRDFKSWKQGVEDAMRIIGEHIRCPMVEDKVREEIDKQARIAEKTEKENLDIANEFEKFFADVDMVKAVETITKNHDFGWEENEFEKFFGNQDSRKHSPMGR